jgi:phage baseplate assembly protein W
MATLDPARALARRALGWGAAAPLVDADDLGRDLVLVPRDGSGRRDLACVEGAVNLGQDLALALTTGLGTDPFNADFGFDGIAAMVEPQPATLTRERLRASVAKTVARDPRVRAVTTVDVSEGSAGIERVLRLRVVVDTITSDVGSLATNLVLV